MTIYTKDLAKMITAKSDLHVDAAMAIVQDMVKLIISAVEEGDKVFITNFGDFSFKLKPARKARNPKTGETIMVDPYSKLTFTPVLKYRKVR